MMLRVEDSFLTSRRESKMEAEEIEFPSRDGFIRWYEELKNKEKILLTASSYDETKSIMRVSIITQNKHYEVRYPVFLFDFFPEFETEEELIGILRDMQDMAKNKVFIDDKPLHPTALARKIVELIEPSSDRVKPICPISGECGGCALMELGIEKQLEYKSKILDESFSRLGGIDISSVDFEGTSILQFNWRGTPLDGGGNALSREGRIVLSYQGINFTIIVSPQTASITIQ